MANLSDKEQKALEEIINQMIREGLIEYVGGPRPTYAVTRKGLDVLC
jgi:predicted transcriptional regulator